MHQLHSGAGLEAGVGWACRLNPRHDNRRVDGYGKTTDHFLLSEGNVLGDWMDR